MGCSREFFTIVTSIQLQKAGTQQLDGCTLMLATQTPLVYRYWGMSLTDRCHATKEIRQDVLSTIIIPGFEVEQRELGDER